MAKIETVYLNPANALHDWLRGLFNGNQIQFFNAIFWYNYYFQVASKNLRYSEGVLVSHVGSLIDARILYLTVKNGCISNYIITYKMMNNCLLIIFQQALIKEE